MGRTGTRAGFVGAITDTELKAGSSAGSNGFGVFAYYTDNATYADASSTPNFMYNQQVYYNTSAWTYSPVKYWPNEFDTTDGISSGTDRLTFFAYAPYVDSDPTTGSITSPGTSGIIAFVENDDQTFYKNSSIGDPRIKYTVNSDPTNFVDLLWGVAKLDPTDTDYEITNNNTTSADGLPWLNITKQKTSGKIDLKFEHALAKLIFNVDADVDDVRDGSSDHGKDLANNTKIFVRSVKITGKIATTGYLNLNNTTADQPLWEEENGSAIATADQNVVFKDGRTDGSEGYADDDTPTPGLSSTETVVGLNNVIIQTATTGSGPYTISTNAGVTKTAVPLLTNNGAFYVIPTTPTTANTFTIQIVYDVLTEDSRLNGTLADGKVHGSIVENDITKTANITISAGKAYTFNLHLGMTSVTMDASVTDWLTGTEEIDLPKNQ